MSLSVTGTFALSTRPRNIMGDWCPAEVVYTGTST